MRLKCTINGKEYTNVVQGISFADEFNETLDSGAIIISDVSELNIEPYDDVYIYEGSFNGHSINGYDYKKIYAETKATEIIDNVFITEISIDEKIWEIFNKKDYIEYYTNVWYIENNRNIKKRFKISFDPLEGKKIIFSGDVDFTLEYDENEKKFKSETTSLPINIASISVVFVYKYDGQKPNGFYKHLLVDSFQRESINLSEGIFKYKINLFSETKRLETIPLPNISITQPLNFEKKKTVWFYLEKYVNLYSPLVKLAIDSDDNEWIYVKKLRLDPELKSIFDKVYSPDFSLNHPNLRDLISKLMLTKDYIPVLKDNVITGIKISETKGPFDDKNINFITGALSSANYCNNLKRTYSNALSENSSCHSIEYLSFRNSSSALLTLNNMRLETRFPIYKINNFIMCYYKKATLIKKDDNTREDRMFLCKTDITPLVKLNSERNLLSVDWDNEITNDPASIEEMGKLKFCTVGYDIGSKNISGWGTKYDFLLSGDYFAWFNKEKTYIENIVKKLHLISPMGMYNSIYLFKEGENPDDYDIEMPSSDEFNFDYMISPFDESSESLKFKSLFFIIDYEGFYNGTIIHSKDNFKDDVTIIDNSSESLTLLEQDGVYQKEKIERYGNEVIKIPARYDSIDELQDVGTVYKDNIIIFHREYSIFDNCINVIYYGSKDYILKNFYTTVYAKHRNYNLMSYEESITRSENKKKFLFLSKDKYFYEEELDDFTYSNKDGVPLYEKLLSFCKDTGNLKYTNKYVFPNKINFAFFKNKINNNTYAYLSDINSFVSGNSLCFNLKMYDNVSGGVYIEKIQPNIEEEVEEDYIGSAQNWYIVVDDVETGKINNIDVYVGHVDEDFFLDSKTLPYDKNLIVDETYNKIFALPQIDIVSNIDKVNNLIGGEIEVFKDNKEELDFTFQYEIFTENKDIFITPWTLKLSDLLSAFYKADSNKTTANRSFTDSFEAYYGIVYRWYLQGIPFIYLKIRKDFFDKFQEGDAVQGSFKFNKQQGFWLVNAVNEYTVTKTFNLFFTEIKKIETADGTTSLPKGTKIMDISCSLELNVVSDEWLGWGQFFGASKTEFKTTTLTFISKEKYIYWKTGSGWQTEDLDDNYYHFFNGSFIASEFNGDLDEVSFYTFYIDNSGNYGGTPSYEKVYGGHLIIATNETDNRIEITDKISSFIKEENKVFVSVAPQSETSTFKKNLFVTYSQEIIVNERFRDETDKFEKNDLIVEKFVGFYRDDKNRQCFKILLNDVPDDANSIQFWFYNEKSQSYHFVFGANITEEDREKKEIVIYCSLLSKKDLRVYDKDNKLIGEVFDFSEDDGKIANRQYYKIKEEQ